MGKNWDVEPLGHRIARLRREKNLTQDDLSRLTDLSVATIAGLEAGAMRFIGEFGDRIAEALGVSPHQLLNVEPYAERESMRTVLEMRQYGQIDPTDQEIESLRLLISDSVKTRSNMRIPLNRNEIVALLTILRGSDGV